MLEFFVGDKKFEIPNSIDTIDKIPRDKNTIINELLHNKKYYVQSNVGDASFKSFLNFLEKDEIPEITKSNYWEYYELSNEFGILKDYLSQEQFQPFFYLNNIINLYTNPNVDKCAIENIIAKNLDHCLTNFPNEIKNIQINSLYNIFNHPEKNLKDQDMAYTFIATVGTQDQKSFFILLETLDAEEMKSEENIIDASIKIKEHCGFSPKNTEKIVLKLKDDLIRADETIQILEEEKNQFQDEAYKAINDLRIAKQKIQNFIKERNKLQDEVNKTKNDLDNAKLKIQNLKKDKIILQEETNKVKKDLSIANKKIQNFYKDKDNLQEEINKTKNDLDDAKMKIQNLKKDKKQFQAETNEAKKDIDIARKKIQNLCNDKIKLQKDMNEIIKEKREINFKLQNVKSILNSFKQRAIQAKIPDDIFKQLWDNKYGNYSKDEWNQDILEGKEFDRNFKSSNEKYEYKFLDANEIYDVLKRLNYNKNVSKREAFTGQLYQLNYNNGSLHLESKDDKSKENQIVVAKNIILWTLINDLTNL